MNSMINVSVVDFSTTPNDTTVYPKDYKDLLLTTMDNPYNPFSDFTHWNNYDEHLGYYTNRMLARLVGSPSEFCSTGLGQEIADKFYYSTLLDVIHTATRIPYVVVSERDYELNGTYKFYSPTIFIKLNTLPA